MRGTVGGHEPTYQDWSHSGRGFSPPYLGRLNPVQLQPELRDAVNAIRAGQITGAIRTPSGFAVLTILPQAPLPQDITDRKELTSLISTGANRVNGDVGGFGEADHLFTSFHKPEGWNRDLHQICEIRKQSYADGVSRLRDLLASIDAEHAGDQNPDQMMQGCLKLAQLYAFGGKWRSRFNSRSSHWILHRSIFPKACDSLSR